MRNVTVNGQAKLLGRVPAAQAMRLVIVLPLRHQAELAELLQRLYNPSSPSYRHFLTVEEFTERFGPSQGDYDAVLHFAKTNGLVVFGNSRNRLNVQVSASIANIEKAFNVTMGVYQHPAEARTFYAPDREPTVDLPFPLWHISGLDNYSIPHPLLRKADSGTGNAMVGSGPNASFLGSDMRAAYYGGTLTGAGQSIGLVEYLGTELSDLTTYYANVGQTNSVPIAVVSTDGTPTNCPARQGCDDTEQTLDMTQALGMAPGLSSLVMYVGSSDSAIFNAMATANPLNAQLSCSWGWYFPDPDVDDPYFQEFAAQGQNLFVASGDSGMWETMSYVYPADDAFVTSVGGTSLQTAGPGGPWTSETAWTWGGGGISPNDILIPSWQTPAISSCSGCSTIFRNGADVSANADFSFYVCSNQQGCTANAYGGTSFAAPMWAGYMALANELAVANGNPPLGFINPVLYSLASGSSYSDLFHDVTSGNNGYQATVGYDLASGWGSPNGSGLINALAGSSSNPGFILSASPASLTVTPGNFGSSNIFSTPTGGFNSAITLSATGQPDSVTVSFNPVSIAATGNSVMTVHVGSSTPGGKYAITVTGISGSVSEMTTALLNVPATLTSIVVSPTNATIQLPGTLQFNAAGNYSDGTTQNLTTKVVWSSSNPGAATVSTSGLATGVAVGSTNIAASFNGITSDPATLAVQPPPPPAATPTFSPAPGTFTSPQMVTLSDATTKASIYYTTNASNPTTSSTLYTGPIPVASTTILKAIAAGNGYGPSSIATATFTIQALAPTFSPTSGTFNSPQTVTLSDPTPGTSIYYTTNGSNPTVASALYTESITVASTTTLKAVAAGNGYGPSSIATALFTIQALAPTFSPASGTFNGPQMATLSDSTPGTSIYYTTNGSNPTIYSALYTGPITVASTTAVKAIAAGNGYGPSSVATAIFTIEALAPTISPAPGTFNSPQTVTLSDSTPGVSVYYTTNGSNPTTSSTLYTGPITVASTTILKAIGAGNGYGPSSIATAIFTIQAPAPTLSPTPGAFNTPQVVTVSDVTAGVSIYYTTNGSNPTTSSTLYTGPITIVSTTTLKTIAAGNGYGPSSITSGRYIINSQ